MSNYKFTISNPTKRFYNDGFGIYSCVVFDDIPHKNDDIITLTGSLQELQYGLEYEVEAELIENERYGFQYKTSTGARVKKPTTQSEQRKFLRSIITDNQTDILMGVYPDIVDKVVNSNFDVDVSKVKGIGIVTWQTIKAKILDNFCISDLLIMLNPIGIKYSQIQKMLSDEPNPIRLKEVLLNNPYSLTSIHGFGFVKVDGFALKIKPESINSKSRAKAYIDYYLTHQGNGSGHTWVDIKEILVQCKKKIPEAIDAVKEVLMEEKIEPNTYVMEDHKIGLARFYKKEINCFNLIKSINDNEDREIKQDNIDESIKQANKEQGFELIDEQVAAVNKIVRSRFSVLEAKAGCGKSVSSRAVLKTFDNLNLSIGCCAFTARAAKMLEESTGYNASTIHRLLEAEEKGKFRYNIDNRLHYDVVLVDEAGMVNVSLLYSLVSALKQGATLILVGDAKQLKPISYGDMFSDIVDRPKDFNVVSLKTVMRQASKSGITVDANKIREGINPIDEMKSMVINGELQDNAYIFREDETILNEFAIQSYLKLAKKDGIDNVVIMTPYKDKRLNSAKEISIKIQEHLLGDESQFISNMGIPYKLGAKVMHIKNNSNKDIYNGDIGYITSIYKDDNNSKKCKVDFGKSVGERTYNQSEMIDLQLAYAMTVHKLQGAGIKNTIIVFDNGHTIMLNTTLFYTAMTRGKEYNITLLTPKALKNALRIDDTRRNTWSKTYIFKEDKNGED